MDYIDQTDSNSSIPIGHCPHEPGTFEWKCYQNFRREQLKKLKDDKEKSIKALEQMQMFEMKMKELQEREKLGELEAAEAVIKAAAAIKRKGPRPRVSTFETANKTSQNTDANDTAHSRSHSHNKPSSNSKNESGPPFVEKSKKIRPKSEATHSQQQQHSEVTNTGPDLNIKVNNNNNNKARHIRTVPLNKVPLRKDTRKSSSSSRGGANHSKGKSSNIDSNPLIAALGEIKIPIETDTETDQVREIKEAILKKAKNTVAVPLCPELEVCEAYPGTKEWDEYWKNFHDAMATYNKQMAEFQKGMQAFTKDLDMYKKEATRIRAEEKLAQQGMALMNPLPPPIITKTVDDITVFNDYVLKAKNLKATVSNQIGNPKGIHMEINVKGIDPNDIQVERTANMLKIIVNIEQFVWIGVPNGKLSKDLVVYPPIYPQTIIVVDSR